MTSKRSLFCSALLVLALAGGTAACGGSSDNDKKSGGNPSSSSTSGGAGDGSSTGSDGSVHFKVVKGVPSDFPHTDVPMVDGKVLNATEGAFAPSGEQVKGWTVRLRYAGAASQALSAAESKLTSAGFTKEKTSSLASDERALKSSSYDVRVRADKLKKGGSVVIYTVIPS